MAVPSSMQGADYVLATAGVIYLGGFMGQDQVVTGEISLRLVADGKLRYVYWSENTRGGAFGGQSDVSSWVSASCVAVQGFDAQTRNERSTGRHGERSVRLVITRFRQHAGEPLRLPRGEGIVSLRGACETLTALLP